MHRLLCRRFDCGDSVHDLLYLFEGTGLDLAHALARHTEFVGQLSKRHRVFGQASAFENAPGARVERAKRNGSRAASIVSWSGESLTSQSCHSMESLSSWMGSLSEASPPSRRFMSTTSCSVTPSRLAMSLT